MDVSFQNILWAEVKALLDFLDSDNNIVTTVPQKRKLAGHLKKLMKKVKKTRRRAKLYSKKLNNRMVKSYK